MTTQTSARLRLRHERLRGITLLLAGMILLAGPGGVQAANIAVDVTNDELNGDADCSLREAIQAANTDSAVSGCAAGSGADTITVPAGTYRLRRVGAGEDGNATGDLDVLQDVTILGAGGFLTVIDGNATDRVLHVLAGTVVVEDVVFQNGLVPQARDRRQLHQPDRLRRDGRQPAATVAASSRQAGSNADVAPRHRREQPGRDGAATPATSAARRRARNARRTPAKAAMAAACTATAR